MLQNKNNVSARMVFVADKMMPKMKKCLAKKGLHEYGIYPAIEMETGLMLATDGPVLVVHKLKDYAFMPSDGVVLGDVVMLPVGVLQMKGRVEVTVTVENGNVLATCTDEKGTTAEQRTSSRYPRWRNVIPGMTGWPIDVNSKAWDAALKEILPKMKGYPLIPVRLFGEAKSTLALCWNNLDTDDRGQKDVSAAVMPFKISTSLNGQKLRDVMAFQPTDMRYVDSMRTLIFYNDDTLCLMLPLADSDYEPCGADKNCLESFDLEKWIGADLGHVVVDNRTLEERLREALLKQFKMAA